MRNTENIEEVLSYLEVMKMYAETALESDQTFESLCVDRSERIRISSISMEVGQIGEQLKSDKMPSLFYEVLDDEMNSYFSQIARMRNRLFHNYEGINEEYLWGVIDEELDDLIEILDRLIEDFKRMLEI